MPKLRTLKLLCIILLVTVSTTGCALALVDWAMGDKKAAHEDDQSVGADDNGGYIN